jgi:hypothetical protein
VAQSLDRIARERFPVVLLEADLKKALAKEERALLAAALLSALEARLLVRLELRSGKTTRAIYAAAGALQTGAPTKAESEEAAPAPPFNDSVRRAYEALHRRTGFPAVNISGLQGESGVAMDELKPWLVEEYQAGRAVLAEGDWSLATPEEREGAIEVHGQRCILVRLLS